MIAVLVSLHTQPPIDSPALRKREVLLFKESAPIGVIWQSAVALCTESYMSISGVEIIQVAGSAPKEEY